MVTCIYVNQSFVSKDALLSGNRLAQQRHYTPKYVGRLFIDRVGIIDGLNPQHITGAMKNMFGMTLDYTTSYIALLYTQTLVRGSAKMVGFCSDKKSRARPLRPGVVSATGGITVRFWSVSWDSPASVCLSPIVSSPCELRCSFRSETGPEQTYAGGVGALFNPARVNDCVVCSKSSSMASCGQLVRPLHLGYLRHGSRASYLLALIMTLLGFVARLHRCFLSNGIREDFSH
ncbi:hypothetical protein Bca52824_037958 [Brassica carinata]|uniref:Uncharacterized protein n=1 Tax=Brassica carinata TaxID=52824 RepID=A0A8X7RLK4_BRACI|nr:hypothetical protein Bca52824_037958 [Brassica carinata]